MTLLHALGFSASLGCFLTFNDLPHLAPDDFDKLRTVIKPRAGEDEWLQIPWQIDLWQARKQAAAEGKPILLWEMDGHPLGCT